MRNWMRSLDVLSPKIELYFEGHNRYFSFAGFLMSIIFLLMMLGLGIFLFISFIKGEEMIVIYSKDINNKVEVDLSQKLFLFSIKDEFGKFADPRAIQSVSSYWVVTENRENVELLKEFNCSNSNYPSPKNKVLTSFDFFNYKCISRKTINQSIILFEDKNSLSSKYLNINITKCKNTTENNEPCYSPEKINEILKNSSFYLHLYTEMLYINNFKKNPLISYLTSEKIPIIPENPRVYKYEMREIIYESDEGMLFPREKSHTDFGLNLASKKLEFYKNRGNSDDNEPYLVFQLGIDNQYIERYHRSYQKFQTFAANIGGVGAFLYFLANLLTVLLSKGEIILSISQSVGEKFRKIHSFTQYCDNLNYSLKNNYIKKKASMSSFIHIQSHIQSQRVTELGKRKKKEFCVFEILFYQYWKLRDNCKHIRKCEMIIRNYLDVKQFICYNHEIDCLRFDSIVNTQKPELSCYGLLKHTKKYVNSPPNEECLDAYGLRNWLRK